MCRTEIVFEAFAQPEANAPLGTVLDLDLPEWDIVVFEVFPQVSGMAAEFVDTDLDGRDSGLATRRRRRLLRRVDGDPVLTISQHQTPPASLVRGVFSV